MNATTSNDGIHKIPQEIIYLNRNATLTIDIVFVNGLPFLIGVSHKIKFTTAEYISNKKQPQLISLGYIQHPVFHGEPMPDHN
jgi:hypothetical protein